MMTQLERKPLIIGILNSYTSTIPLDFNAFLKVLSSFVHLEKNSLKQLITQNDPTEWQRLAEKEQSGYAELSLTGYAGAEKDGIDSLKDD